MNVENPRAAVAVTITGLLCTCMALSCRSVLPDQSVAQPLESLMWITGHWQRIDTAEGTLAGESWHVASVSLLKGVGYSMRGSDTTFVERLVIRLKSESVVYEADVSHNSGPVSFGMISQKQLEVVFENPDHDFPKVISYRRVHDDSLTAVISGGLRQATFRFVRRAG